MAIFGAENPSDAGSEGRVVPFVRSKVFTSLFAHGMELVEETATYLDNEGRRAAKSLDRDAAMTYAGVSMRLTTRLMQIASWLLVLRAVRDDEMSEAEAGDPKYRVGMPERAERPATDHSVLPDTLCELIKETDTLYGRISRIDYDLFVSARDDVLTGDAKGQLLALQRAFSDQ